jgi:HPt (histidine-containing phosphotransfer) domain-containing protein
VAFNPETPAIDQEQIDMFVMDENDEDGRAMVLEVFELFLRESGQRLPELRACCATDDRAGVRKILHFIAGSAANIGLLRLATYFRAVEYAIDEDSVGPLDAAAAAGMVQHYEQACADFRAAVGQ